MRGIVESHKSVFYWHPVLIHFPIAFFFLEALLLVLWVSKKDPAYFRFARFSFFLALGFLAPVLVTGWLDAGGWKNIEDLVQIHFFSGLAASALALLRILNWKRAGSPEDASSWVLLAGALLQCAAVIAAGYYGGLLVYG